MQWKNRGHEYDALGKRMVGKKGCISMGLDADI